MATDRGLKMLIAALCASVALAGACDDDEPGGTGGTTSSAGGTGGHAGQGGVTATGNGGVGAPGPCISYTCAEVLQAGCPASEIQGAERDKLDALTACVCGEGGGGGAAPCAVDCPGYCDGSFGSDAICEGCVEDHCQAERDDCVNP